MWHISCTLVAQCRCRVSHVSRAAANASGFVDICQSQFQSVSHFCVQSLECKPLPPNQRSERKTLFFSTHARAQECSNDDAEARLCMIFSCWYMVGIAAAAVRFFFLTFFLLSICLRVRVLLVFSSRFSLRQLTSTICRWLLYCCSGRSSFAPHCVSQSIITVARIFLSFFQFFFCFFFVSVLSWLWSQIAGFSLSFLINFKTETFLFFSAPARCRTTTNAFAIAWGDVPYLIELICVLFPTMILRRVLEIKHGSCSLLIALEISLQLSNWNFLGKYELFRINQSHNAVVCVSWFWKGFLFSAIFQYHDEHYVSICSLEV